MQAVEWEKTHIEELDLKATELSAETLVSVLTRLPHLRWLNASWLENFTDHVSIQQLTSYKKLQLTGARHLVAIERVQQSAISRFGHV
jgi:hypothetical protein